MKAILDTNILVRIIVRDDKQQADLAERLLAKTKLVVVPTTVLCELVWVLHRVYRVASTDVAITLRQLLETENFVTCDAAVEAGLNLLEAGGDFADGVIAFEGASLGGETFYSFDKVAITKLTKQGVSASLPTK